MTLDNMLKAIDPLHINGEAELEISGLAYNSRQVRAGYLFFALPGVNVDGASFIPQAIKQGASAIVTEHDIDLPDSDTTLIKVSNARLAMAKMSAAFYGYPSRDLPVLGITGTNGKTTITYLLEAILKAAGYNPAVFGTIEYRCGHEKRESSHTTPESLELIRMMHEFRELGADSFILEASSHALEQHRTDGVEFDVAGFTNLTAEHLDYHHTLDEYFSSKKRLFSDLLPSGKGVANCEDRYGRRLIAEYPSVISFGRTADAEVKNTNVQVSRSGIHGTFRGIHGALTIDSQLIGDFNVSNLLCAVALAQQLGIDDKNIEQGIRSMTQVPGRVEAVANEQGVLALVDYAHTGDALEQVLNTLVKLDHSRCITVVGCGGDRDSSKRPVMAKAAIKYADLVIFTSDNPRTEDPQQILDQIKAGAIETDAKELSPTEAQSGEDGFVMIADRRTAIAFACQVATRGDLLLVAGKGHEDYQILGTEKIHFDDREELNTALATTQSGSREGACHV